MAPLLEQAAGAEGIVVAGAATPPHEPSETEFEGHAAFLASAESGRKFGRPAKLTSEQAALAQRMKATGETAATICKTLGIRPHHPVPLPGRERRGRKHFATAKRMNADGHFARDVAKYLGVSRATLYRFLTDEAA